MLYHSQEATKTRKFSSFSYMTRENFINVKWEIIVFVMAMANSETLCDENDYFNIRT